MAPQPPHPFFTAPGTPGGRRMLLVSVAYPPNAEVGALRWQRIAQFARTRDWTIDVILVDPTDPSIREEGRLSEVPAGARLYDVPLQDVAAQRGERALRRLLSARSGPRRAEPATGLATDRGNGNAGAPAHGQGRAARDGAVSGALRGYRTWVHFAQWNDWAARAAALGTALGRETTYALVASSGPPHHAHLAARAIATAIGRPLVIDLRDPWFSDDVEPPGLRGPLWRRRTARDEARTVQQSALVVVNTDSCRALMAERYPQWKDRFLTIMNGADPDVATAASIPSGGPFILSHTGSLYSGRDPRILFRAAARVVQRLALSPADLRVHFMGDDVYEGRPLMALAEECGVAAYTVVERRRPRAEALALIRASAMVVLLPQQHVHSIPGKVFEYVQLAAWPLILADRDSATEVFLRDTGADVLDPNDDAGVARAIERRYVAFRAGERPAPLNADGRFNRDRQVAMLLDALDSLA